MERNIKLYGILDIELNLLEYEENIYKNLINKLEDILSDLYFDCKARVFLINCELGISMWCGEIILNVLNNFRRDIYLYSMLPSKNREIYWSAYYQKRYRKLVENCNLKDICRLNKLLEIVFKENKSLTLLDVETLNIINFY